MVNRFDAGVGNEYSDGGMIMKKPLPIGVDNFEKLIKDGYCYIDKTMFIKELLDLKGEVNLFLRTRRFDTFLKIRGILRKMKRIKRFFKD